MLMGLLKLCDTLDLSYKSSDELNKIIDEHIPGRPRFKRREIIVGGEAYEVFFRDVIECIRALYGDVEFARYLLLVPVQHWADKNKTIQLFHDMHTGNWWWTTQVSLMSILVYCSHVGLGGTRAAKPRRDSDPRHHRIGQDASDTVP